MPEVDPLQPENAKLLANKNTEAAEQLNSWMSGRTASGLEMTRGHFAVYWWALFDAHNEWLEGKAACSRRHFASSGQGRDPDKPKMRKKWRAGLWLFIRSSMGRGHDENGTSITSVCMLPMALLSRPSMCLAILTTVIASE